MDDDLVSALQTICRSGGKPMVRCQICGTKYLFKLKGRPKRYCSDKCRLKGYRLKQKAAKDKLALDKSN